VKGVGVWVGLRSDTGPKFDAVRSRCPTQKKNGRTRFHSIHYLVVECGKYRLDFLCLELWS
jgi:hypothetical protein